MSFVNQVSELHRNLNVNVSKEAEMITGSIKLGNKQLMITSYYRPNFPIGGRVLHLSTCPGWLVNRRSNMLFSRVEWSFTCCIESANRSRGLTQRPNVQKLQKTGRDIRNSRQTYKENPDKQTPNSCRT
jgi:hypothetical protein